MLGHDAVRDVAAVAWPSRELGEEVAAFVVTAAPVEEAALLGYCRENLARYKVPRGVFFVDALPRNGFGKVLKKDLSAGLEPV